MILFLMLNSLYNYYLNMYECMKKSYFQFNLKIGFLNIVYVIKYIIWKNSSKSIFNPSQRWNRVINVMLEFFLFKKSFIVVFETQALVDNSLCVKCFFLSSEMILDRVASISVIIYPPLFLNYIKFFYNMSVKDDTFK